MVHRAKKISSDANEGLGMLPDETVIKKLFLKKEKKNEFANSQ